MAASRGDGRTLTKWNLARVWQCSGPEFRRAVRWLDGKVLTGKPTVLDLLDAGHGRPSASACTAR